ncbi:MAG: aminopeptidase N [Pseudonocardia sp.]|uniref:aminopeptidase N n=1 Tax=unclassified Pseudonocardia TaxID=2619320 RepID=UPI00086D84A8|nr:MULTISPECIES: aminopeptidase N [unclassified Pseudonocardia]MBN9110163.1 aminopeptidase N [Pseudonocardia sp.]ODV07271.1 MAG: aminopeptidase N [Pseudonocardia sp. SCN 73-27]
MAPPNLTRADAELRASAIEVDSYTVDLDLTDGAGAPGETTFATTTTVRFRGLQPGTSSWIDFVGESVASATLNGTALDVSGYREDDGIALPALAADNELTVVATGRYMNTGEGLHRFVDPVDDGVYLYSQFETADAKRLFACFDQPDLKARYTITVTAPESWKVVSNAAADSVEKGVHRFATTEIMSTYLVALIAGPYAEWTDTYSDGDGPDIPLGIYCRASLAEHMDAERMFTETKQGFGFYHRNFGVRYPFGKYDELFVPEFNAGAMENAGAVTFLEDYVFRSRVTRFLYERRAETILHEMAHMWFGDLVTMRWWDDLWLNESFATWASVICQAEATEYTNAWTTFANVEKSWAYRQDQLPSTHPVAADIPDLQAVEVNFDGITYAKGASVLKQLVSYVGLDAFMTGLRAYFDAHAWGNATFDDLLGALEEASGRDLSDWGAQWLRTTGLNMLRPSFDVDEHGRIVRFEVVQGGARPGAGELRTHRIAVGVYDDEPQAGDAKGSPRLVRTHRVEVDVTGERTPVPDLIGVPRGKLVLVNDDDLTYCALRLDPDSLTVLVDRIGDIAEPLPRTLCWSAAWEMTREAELKARDFVSLVAGGFGAETEIGVVQRLLMQAQTSVASYADETWSAERGWPLLVDALRFRLDTAPPGSDAQLSVVNSLAACVLDDATLERFRGWLLDVDVPKGLSVDTDMRWRLLQALSAHGKAGDAEIDAELERDPTSTGRRQAERARALVPTAEAKATAWERAVHDDDIPNAVNEAIIGGFSHPGQRHLLTAYVERYFAEVADVWERRTSERAQSVVLGLFPSWAVEKSTVDAADAWLADESHPPALRRLVSEGRAGIVRALAAREFDRS